MCAVDIFGTTGHDRFAVGTVHRFFADLGVDLPDRGGNVAVRCFADRAAHKNGDRSSSCSVNTETGAWKCHGCDASGGAYDAALVLGRSPAEAMELLKRNGMVNVNGTGGHDVAPRMRVLKPCKTTDADATRYAQELLANNGALERLQELCGWSAETVKALGIGIGPCPLSAALGERRVVFPRRDATGQVIAAVYFQPNRERRTAEGKKSLSDGSRVLWWAPVEGEEWLFVVEGEPAAAAMHSMGLSAVGVPGAKSWRREWAEEFRGRRVCVVPDSDQDGRDLAERIAGDIAGVADAARVLDLWPTRDDGYDVRDELVKAVKENGDKAYAGMRSLLLSAVEHAPVVDVPPTPAPVNDVDPSEPTWPAPLADAALHGLAGDIVRALEPHTEADVPALLMQTLTAFGNSAGRDSYVIAESDRHPCGIFVALVGDTSKGRKGTSWGRVRAVFEHAAPEWLRNCVTAGAVSGEGLIWEVRDPTVKAVPVMDGKTPTGDFEEQTVDPGIDDKRRLWFAGEFASILNATSRERSTLSATLRELWDRGDMRTAAKNNPAQTTGAHTSLVGHITRDELRRSLTHTETVNGFANRFLFVCARRSKELPEPSRPDQGVVENLAARLGAAIQYASTAGELERDDEARALWREVYGDLSRGRRGLLGAATTRAEAYVLRLSLAYALLDLSPAIRVEHLRAALAVWRYCFQSAAHVFGDQLGDPDSDAALAALRKAPLGLTRTELRDVLGKHKPASAIARALKVLDDARLAECRQEATGGRPVERWFAANRGVGKKGEKVEKGRQGCQTSDFSPFSPFSPITENGHRGDGEGSA